MLGPLEDRDPARIGTQMLQPQTHPRPRRFQRKLLRPFQNHHRWRSENILKTQSLKIMKTLNPVQIPVIDLRRPAINVNQSKRRTRNLVRARGTKSRNNPLSQSSLPAPKLPGQQHQQRRFQSRRKFPAPPDRLFRRPRNDFFTHAAATPAKVPVAQRAPPQPLRWPTNLTGRFPPPPGPPPPRANKRPAPEPAANRRS